MSIEIQVSDRVVIHDVHVYAETSLHVYRKTLHDVRNQLRLGDRVREGCRIGLSDGWERFPVSGPLPEQYVEAIAYD